ncbi:MAG: hypothetical protein ACMUEL_06770 [Flavobacteriales bacterium Tduv]
MYAKTGDNGRTVLYGSRRVSKNNLHVEAYRKLDHLNAWVDTFERPRPSERNKKQRWLKSKIVFFCWSLSCLRFPINF